MLGVLETLYHFVTSKEQSKSTSESLVSEKQIISQEEQEGMATWQDLPVEIQELIFTHLPVRSIAHCCCVAKAWASLSSSNQLWRYYYERDIALSATSDNVEEWKEEYKDSALTPTWDPKHSSVAFAFSNENKKIRRKGGEGFFPKAITTSPLTMRRYRLEIILYERGELGLVSQDPGFWREGMEDKGDFWYTIWDGYVRRGGKQGVPECSFFGVYADESFTFSYLAGIYQPRKIVTRNNGTCNSSVIGMEIADDQVSWYENGELRATTQLPKRPFYLCYCTPYSDTQTEITHCRKSLAYATPTDCLSAHNLA